MTEEITLTGPSPEALAKMLESGGGAFMDLGRALSGLTDEQSHIVPDGAPHAIADVLAHMNYWQDWLLKNIGGDRPPLPEHAEGGWPSVPQGGWDDLLQSFSNGIDACIALTRDETALAVPFCWGSHLQSVGHALMSTAVHNGYHLGQIVLLRQMIGAWPPEGGAYTW